LKIFTHINLLQTCRKKGEPITAGLFSI